MFWKKSSRNDIIIFAKTLRQDDLRHWRIRNFLSVGTSGRTPSKTLKSKTSREQRVLLGIRLGMEIVEFEKRGHRIKLGFGVWGSGWVRVCRLGLGWLGLGWLGLGFVG